MLFCLGGASIFGWLLAFYQVPDMVTEFITAFTQDPIVIMVLIVVVNVLLGTFMDALPAILIFVPIIHPLAVAVGIHPVHLGVIVVMTQSFGLLTPPLGMVRDDRLRGGGRADDQDPEAPAHHDDPAADRHHPVRARALDGAAAARLLVPSWL